MHHGITQQQHSCVIFLQVDDLKRICQDMYSEEELNRIIAGVDRDGDGKIDYHEFLEMMEEPDDE